jgi:hypothetical protein
MRAWHQPIEKSLRRFAKARDRAASSADGTPDTAWGDPFKFGSKMAAPIR